jgi:hypothetical protein
MQITYQRPLNREHINLSFTFAIVFLIGLLFVNFLDALSITDFTKTICNIVLIPLVFLMFALIAINYYEYLRSKKSLKQIILEYNSFPLHYFNEEKFEGFYLNDNKLSIHNYEPLDRMPKNIAPYFIGEEADARK